MESAKSNGPCAGSGCNLYLARITGPMQVEIVDGCHSDHAGVAKAAKLHDAIFKDKGPWAMVQVHPMPALDPPINDAAAADCAAIVEQGR